MKKAVIHSDGASSGNPGDSGIGAVVESGGETREISEYIGVATNNVAEYRAFIAGLEAALAMGAEAVEAYMDSELIVKQISGAYRVKNRGLVPLHLKVRNLLNSFKSYSVRHVPREENKRADALAKKGAESKGQTE